MPRLFLCCSRYLRSKQEHFNYFVHLLCSDEVKKWLSETVLWFLWGKAFEFFSGLRQTKVTGSTGVSPAGMPAERNSIASRSPKVIFYSFGEA